MPDKGTTDLDRRDLGPEPRGDEIIVVKGLKSSSPEYNRLLSCGVSAQEMQIGRIPRAKLLEAGYVFLNRVGNGEKPILSAVIIVEEQKLDLGSKVLLTENELQMVYSHQRQNPEEYGVGDLDVEAVSLDANQFLEEAVSMVSDIGKRKQEVVIEALGKIDTDPSFSDEDRQCLVDFLEKNPSQIPSLIEECLAGLNVLMLRGIPFDVVRSRASALAGRPSPFLDSNFRFSENLDITLFPHDHARTVRLNSMVLHLFERGLNEMGGSLNGSHDQSYMTLGRYVREVFSKKDLQDNKTVPDELRDIVAVRLMVRALRARGLSWEGKPFMSKPLSS